MEEKRPSNKNEDPPGSLEIESLFPDNYQVESYLGEGSFGQVIRCFKKDTEETVAVKVPGHNVNISDELNVLRYLQWHHLDKYNIVRFIEAVQMKDNRVALVFENLDMTLHDYIFYQGDFKGLYLHDVRSVIQQMGTALNALKSKGVIHSDIKSDNIMLVDGEAQPIRVKLIDFGLAIPAVKARLGATYQIGEYRAPEIYLGLPFTESIDMWSLGIIMVLTVLGIDLISGNTRYDRMQRLVELFGVPPDHLLNMGLYSNNYFTKTPSGHWRFKTPREYWGFHTTKGGKTRFQLNSLDQLETLSVVNLDMVEADERRECIDLMKGMLRLDPNERITPFEVLNHPFIKRGTVQHSSENEQPGTSNTRGPKTHKTKEPGTGKPEEPRDDETKEPLTNEPEEPGTGKPEEPRDDETKEPGTNEPEEPGTGQPEEPRDDETKAPGTNEPEEPGTGKSEEPGDDKTKEPGTNEPEEPGTGKPEEPGDDETMEPGANESEEPGTDETTEWQTTHTDEPEESNDNVCSTHGNYGPVLPGVMLACSPDFDSSVELEENMGQQFYTCLNSSSGFQGSIPPSSSRRVILVHPAPPDCRWDLNEDNEQQSESCSNNSSGFQESISSSSARRVILVQPAPPDCRQELDEEHEQQNDSCAIGSSGFHESIPASSSRRVILVQSAPPDCCWDLDEDDESQSEYCSAVKLENPSEDNPAEYPQEDKCDCPYRLFLPKARNLELNAATSDHTDPKKKRKKKKKKKNCFKRFFSWTKKTFCSCIVGHTDQD